MNDWGTAVKAYEEVDGYSGAALVYAPNHILRKFKENGNNTNFTYKPSPKDDLEVI